MSIAIENKRMVFLWDLTLTIQVNTGSKFNMVFVFFAHSSICKIEFVKGVPLQHTQ